MIGRIAARIAGGLALAASLAACGLSAPNPTSGAARPAGSVGPAGADSVSPTATRSIQPISALIHPAAGKYLGLEVNGAPDSLAPVIPVGASIGRNPNLLGQYVTWNSPFDARAAANSVSYGALYFISWEPYNTTVQAIADGASDAYISRFARAVRSFGEPVALSFGHEMNGNWYPWATNGTTAAEFVAAWRHIHDLFTQAGAGNVIWVWDPNIINPMPNVQLRPYWPGDAYVNWVGLTGYFATTGPHTFAGLYGPTMTEISSFTSEPFIIAETSVETGPSETASVGNLIGGVKEHSNVLGLIWFNYDKLGIDWTLGARPEVRAAVAASLDGMQFVSLNR